MDYRSKMAYINQNLLSKEEVITSVEKYIEHCESTPDEGWSENKREVILKMLQRFLDCLKKTRFPELKSVDWFYQYTWKEDGIILELLHCDAVECEENGEISYLESSDAIVLAEVKCEYLTVEEYARKYGVTVTAVRQWIRRGKLRSAKKMGRDWLIPELADRPRRGYEPVTYMWDYIPENLIKEFPFLEQCSELSMMQSESEKNIFDILLKNRYGRTYEKRYLNASEREKLELALISEPSVQAKELRQDIMFVPGKETESYLYGGRMMGEEKYNTYQERLALLKSNHLEIATTNYMYDEDGMLIWEFFIELSRWNFDEDEDENKDGKKEVIARLENGIVIPAETDFQEENSEYSSAAELCDNISGDIYSAYNVVADEENGIKEEILKELNLPEEAAYESSILYIQNIETNKMQDLKLFLETFDIAVEALPAQYCSLAIYLLNWERESEKVKTFLECNWKIRSIDQSAVLAYRKL